VLGFASLQGCNPNTGQLCGGVTCDAGESCVNNVCVADSNGCTTDADCDAGETCSNGACEVASTTGCTSDLDCADGEICNTGVCEPASTNGCTTDADCDEGEACSNGACVEDVDTNGTGGDATAGATFYSATCQGCHGADAVGGIGPNIQGFTAAELQAGLEAAAIHDSLTVTAEDYANLEAYLATL
jgi:hypothetical protein